jgi:hypothetical protein
MHAPRRQHWFWTAVLAGIAYVVIGLTTAALSRSASSVQIRTLCRLAAWAISAVTFAAHIGHEHRRHTSASRLALHTAVAVALASLALAGSAVAHQLTTTRLRPSMLLAFAVWPILTGVPAFLVALGAGAALGRGAQRTADGTW